jgi:hypothetical protein
MSEPRRDLLKQDADSPADGQRTEPYVPPPPDPQPQPDAADLFDALPEPTDDAPTVISKAAPRPAPAEDPFGGGLRGRRLAHFELIEPIGVGGMAAVLRARDTQLDRTVALKILPPDMAADSENVRRFHQEARSAAKLDHENIARVFFCGEDQRLHFIAFEFVEGENLRTLLERRGRLPVAEALNYMLQVAAGLAHAASRGVVHRDIKPSNIIISPNGRAKLVDMGLARSLEPQHDMGLTQSGVTLGTFDYISPEQALEPRDADVRSDIYSLGCTFYHVLTGVPPVPEGTAAKKLHHHQHVKPLDPRQLVPDLPDEVVVILDRMMAKNPRDRYQSPEHLTHHLVLAAKKLGAAAEVPEGVVFVDAPLPNLPASRPVFLAALLAAAVVGLILILEQTTQQPRGPERPVRAGNTDKGPSHGGNGSFMLPMPDRDHLPDKVETSVPPGQTAAVYDAEEPTAAGLAEWLQQHKGAPEIEIQLARDLNLTTRDEGRSVPGLVLAARKVTIRPKYPDRKPAPAIYLSYDGRPASFWAALTIASEESVVKGLRFLLDARAAKVEMAGLVLRGGRKHRVEGCEFVQAVGLSADDEAGLASILLEATSEVPPTLNLAACTFLGFERFLRKPAEEAGQADVLTFHRPDVGGRDAVVRQGAARIDVSQCVFGPHEAAFRLKGSGRGGEVLLTHCSVVQSGRAAVFQAEDRTEGTIGLNRCLVSRPEEPGPGVPAGREGTVVVRQTAPAGELTFQGGDNRYHNLDAFWAGPSPAEDVEWTGFARKLADEGKGKDVGSRVLTESPWKNDPLRQLEEGQLAKAFRVNDRLRVLRPLEDDKPSAAHLIGAEACAGESYVANLPALEEKKPDAVANQRIVEPGKEDSSKRIYPSLAAAIEAAAPGDVLLVKHNGLLPVRPIRLETKVDLTIQAHPGYHPILTLGDATDSETALFRLHVGKLRLKKLEFRLRPTHEKYEVQALAALMGEGLCELEDCVVTLDRGNYQTALALAALPRTNGIMVMEGDPHPAGQGPRLSLTNCFVRGDGDLVLNRYSRPAEVKAESCLIALSGSLLNVEVGTDKPTASAGQVVTTLTRVTTFLGAPLLRLQAGKDLKGLVAVQCNPSACLFVAASGRPLVQIDAPETTEERLRDKLLWSAANPNKYANFTDLLRQQPGGEEMGPLPWGWMKWQTFAQESNSTKIEGLRSLFASPPGDGAFPQLTLGKFKPADVAAGSSVGVDVNLLPHAADEAEAGQE